MVSVQEVILTLEGKGVSAEMVGDFQKGPGCCPCTVAKPL